MERSEFKERMKQYKKAREENPGLKYWEWKDIPKYYKGTAVVMGPPTEEEWTLQNNKNALNIFDKIALEKSIDISKAALNLATNDLYKRISGRDRYERAAHHTSAGSIDNLMSYIWDSNPLNTPNYTGSYKKRYDNNSKLIRSGVQGNMVQTLLATLVADNVNVDRDLVKNFIYGEDQGFIKSKKKPITVNGVEYKDRQYEGNIAPYDTLFFPKSMQPTIDSLVQGKDIFSINHNDNYIPSVYKLYKQETYDLDNVAKHSGVIKKQNNNYFTTLFDLWDFLGDYSYAPDWLAHKFLNDLQPDLYFPNAGPFVLRQDIPIKFVEDSILDQTRPSGRYFLENLNITPNKNGKRNKASVKLKEFINLWNTDLSKIKNEKVEKARESIRKIKYADGGQVEPDPLEVLERSRPKIAGIPINDKPLSGTDPIGEAVMWGLGGGAASVALRSLFPTYGATAGWLAFGDNNKENVLIVPNNVNKSKLPVAKDLVNYDVKEFFENDVVPRDVIYPIESKQSFLNDANFMYDIYPESHFELNVAGYYDNINKKVVVNNLYAGDLKSINRIGTHEFGHKYNDQFELDNPHKRILNNAYTVEENKIGRTARGARRTNEKRETNKNIRYDMYVELLEKLGRSPSPSEVDDFIDSLSDREILRRVRNSNMYGSAYFESISERAQRIKQPIGTYTRTRASKIRKALKQVAMNERSKDDQNYA